MSNTFPVRWGIVGCGDVTEVKSGPAYQNVAGFELSAVMARTPGKAEDYAKRHGVAKHYNKLDDLIQDPDIDAIYIATPPDSHLDIALQVAKANKIACVEKPMAVNYAQCQQMQQAFAAKNLPLFVAYYRRSLPGFVAIKQWIEQGLIGTIRHIDWQYSRSPSAQDISGAYNWRTDKNIAPGGYFDDLASHGLNVMTYLLGEITQAQGIATNQQGFYSAHDAIVANLLFANGATGTGNWNFASHKYQDKIEILGDKGSILFSIFGDEDAVLTNTQGSIKCSMPKPSPIQGHFVQAMADHLAGLSQHPSLADSAAQTNWVMDKILGI